MNVFFYSSFDGKSPFEEWLNSLRDPVVVSKIKVRLKRVEESGHLGETKYLESGVSEFKFKGRYGYLRVYYSEIDEGILVLNGGHKDNQSRDVEKAKEFLADYEQREGTNQS